VNIYAVAMMASRFGVLDVEAGMLYGDSHDAVFNLGLKNCQERFPSDKGYYDHRVAVTGYDLLRTLQQLNDGIATTMLKERRLDDGLTLATLCDMVLGEDAEDRSNYTLIRAIGKLARACPELDKGE
jgi:hypothetical protein